MRRTSLTVVGIAVLVGALALAAGRAQAGWQGLNIVHYDDGGRVCTDAMEFSVADFVAGRTIEIVNTTPEPDVVVFPATQFQLTFQPVPELFGPGEPYVFSRTFRLPLSPQPAPGDELHVVLTGGTGNGTALAEVAGCTLGPSFGGFFGGVANPPALNRLKNDSKPVKLKFDLGGDFGLDICAAGESPTYAPIPCAPAPVAPEYQPSTAIGTLRFDEAEGRYRYDWQPPAGLTGCYELFFRTTVDGLTHRVLFDFG
jgi:hypothetical protein